MELVHTTDEVVFRLALLQTRLLRHLQAWTGLRASMVSSARQRAVLRQERRADVTLLIRQSQCIGINRW